MFHSPSMIFSRGSDLVGPYSFSRLSDGPFSPRLSITRRNCLINSTPDSPLTVISNDLQYLESAFGVDLHKPIETVVDAHDQVVCTLNPTVAEQRSKELESKVQELHEELMKAHSEIHDTEDKLHQTIEYLTEMEDKLSRLQTLNSDNQSRIQMKSKKTQPVFDTSQDKQVTGLIENNLDLGAELKNFWYPVEFSSKLDSKGKLTLELFGESWILFRNESGVPCCLQDECLHQYCGIPADSTPETKIYSAYHGWEFNSEKKCIKTPSTVRGQDVNVRFLSVAEVDGFVWIWPGDKTPNEVPRCSLPPSSFEIHAELMIEVPVEHGLLLENLLDLAHAPFTHTSTFAKGWPIPDIVKFHTSKLLGGNWDPYPIDMSFETPCMVVSTIGLAQPGKIERGVRASSCAHHLHQLHVCLPTNNRTTRLLYRMSLDFMHWTKNIPGILQIWKNVAKQVMGEDLVLVVGQQDRMLRGSSVWRNPVSYDKLGVRYRRWRNALGGKDQLKTEQQLKPMTAGDIFSPDLEL